MDNITYFHYNNAIMWVFHAILIRMFFYCADHCEKFIRWKKNLFFSYKKKTKNAIKGTEYYRIICCYDVVEWTW